MDNLLKGSFPEDFRGESLFKQLEISNLELGSLIDQMLVSARSPDSDTETARRTALTGQLEMKVQFISDDANRLIAISHSRIISAQTWTGFMVLCLILAVILSNTIISILSGRNVVRSVEELRKSRQTLAESEEHYRIMGEILPFGVWRCDAEGRAEYVSESFLELLDMSMGRR